jgi:hypothetical protein
MKAADVSIDRASLDRLVDGELDEPSRAALLRALDRQPDGWKRCALTFLEAQAWREAMPAVAVAHAQPTSQSRPAFRRAFAVAAAVAVAFCGGFVARGPERQQQLAVKHDPAPASSPAPAPPPPAVPEYVRSRMERQGYRVEGGRKVVELALDDGRKVAVPVDTLSYRYVGQRIH